MHRQTFKTILSEGGGEGKHFCDYDYVSIPGKEEIGTRFWFVSTSFVRGRRYIPCESYDKRPHASRFYGHGLWAYTHTVYIHMYITSGEITFMYNTQLEVSLSRLWSSHCLHERTSNAILTLLNFFDGLKGH